MAVEKVIEYFKKFGMEDRIIQLGESSATVELAAKALGTQEERIAKTLSFLVDGGAVLIVTSGDKKVDNSKFKAFFGTKAKMLSPEQVDGLVGHSIGGVCPFGINEGCRVYLDVSLKRFDVIYPAAGSSNGVARLTVDELEELSGRICWVDVCK